MIEFGNINQDKIYKVTITNGTIFADIINYGAILTSLRIKNENEEIDVVLGYDTLEEYLLDTSAFGRTIGRVSNRIKDGKFTLNDVEYSLPRNNGGNCLHGGSNGISQKIWHTDEVKSDSISLSCFSPDGEEGFPGNLTAKLKYSITKENGLKIEYNAVCDKDTPISFTNHSYFNLNGHGTGDILSHKLKINSNVITPVDSSLCTYNEYLKINDTVFDFTSYKEIGKDIEKEDKMLKICNGYDINFVFDGDITNPIACVVGDKTGLKMDVYTDQKGMQVYTANFLTNRVGKGKIYDKRHGVCFETQAIPNAVNCDKYPSCILKKGNEYKATTEYRFSK